MEYILRNNVNKEFVTKEKNVENILKNEENQERVEEMLIDQPSENSLFL